MHPSLLFWALELRTDGVSQAGEISGNETVQLSMKNKEKGREGVKQKCREMSGRGANGERRRRRRLTVLAERFVEAVGAKIKKKH